MAPPKGRRASCVGAEQVGVCTVVLLSLSHKPMMNLHKVPLNATILMIKEKISQRLRDVGRSLPADREKKCLCVTTQKSQKDEFTVTVPFAFNASHLEHYIAECLNCGADRTAITLYWDNALQEAFPRETTLRQLGIAKDTTLYAVMPPNYSHDRLKIIELPQRKPDAPAAAAAEVAAAAGQTTATQAEAAATGAAVAGAAAAAAEDLALTDAVETTGVTKSPQQIAFEQRANSGYAPSKKEIAALPAQIDFKAFQAFLNIAMHPEDSDGQGMKDFFSSFDTQVTGDLTRKQVSNVLQMWGEEPLTAQEAEEFCQMLFTSGESSIPIKSLVEL